MKIAVTFLLLGISSFIETSNGLPFKLNPLPKDKVPYYVRGMETAMEKAEILEKSPEQERKTREKCLGEDLMHIMKMLALDLGCTLNDVSELLELPLDAQVSLTSGNVTSLLSVIKVDILLSSVIRGVEELLAQVGSLLEEELMPLVEALGSTVDVLGLNLHKSLEAITTSLADTVLGSGLGAVPGRFVGSEMGGIVGILG